MAELLHVDATVRTHGVRVSVRVEAGEHLAVVGPNGTGKSTLLRLVAGDLRPSDGEVWLDGQLLADPTHFVPPHRRSTAFVEQRPTLFPHLDVLDNVMFGLRARGVGRRRARARALEELEVVGLAELRRRRPHQLSGGQAQRLTIARALATDPLVLLLDEPFAALDVTATPELRRLLRQRLDGVTTLLVTHDPVDALVLAERLVAIEDGEMVADGPTASLLDAPPTPFLAALTGLNRLDLPEGAVVVAPSEVFVTTQTPTATGHAACVTQVAPARGCVELTMELHGQPLVAELSPVDYAAHEWAPGDTVSVTLGHTKRLD